MNMCLVRTDESGKEIWTSYIRCGQGYDYANAVQETGDGDILIVGHTNSFGAGSFDFWLVKVSPES